MEKDDVKKLEKESETSQPSQEKEITPSSLYYRKGNNLDAYREKLRDYVEHVLGLTGRVTTHGDKKGVWINYPSPFNTKNAEKMPFGVNTVDHFYLDWSLPKSDPRRSGNLLHLIGELHGVPRQDVYKSDVVRNELISCYGDTLLNTPRTHEVWASAYKADQRAAELMKRRTSDEESVACAKQWIRIEEKMIQNLKETGTLFGKKLPKFPKTYSVTEGKEGYIPFTAENYLMVMLDNQKQFADPRYFGIRAIKALKLLPKDPKEIAPVFCVHTNTQEGLRKKNIQPIFNAEMLNGKIPEGYGYIPPTVMVNAKDPKEAEAMRQAMEEDEVRKNLKDLYHFSGKDWRTKQKEAGIDPEETVYQTMSDSFKYIRSYSLRDLDIALATQYALHYAGSTKGIQVKNCKEVIQRLEDDVNLLKEQVDSRDMEELTPFLMDKGNVLHMACIDMRKATQNLITGEREKLQEKARKRFEDQSIETREKSFNNLTVIARTAIPLGEERILPIDTKLKGEKAYLLLKDVTLLDRSAWENPERIYKGKRVALEIQYNHEGTMRESQLGLRVRDQHFEKTFSFKLGDLDTGSGKTVTEVLTALSMKSLERARFTTAGFNQYHLRRRNQLKYQWNDERKYENLEKMEKGQEFGKMLKLESRDQLRLEYAEKQKDIAKNLDFFSKEEVHFLNQTRQNDIKIAKQLSLRPNLYRYELQNFGKQDIPSIKEVFQMDNVLDVRAKADFSDKYREDRAMVIETRKPLKLDPESGVYYDERDPERTKPYGAKLFKTDREIKQLEQFNNTFKVNFYMVDPSEKNQMVDESTLKRIDVGSEGKAVLGSLIAGDKEEFERIRKGERTPGAATYHVNVSYQGVQIVNKDFQLGDFKLGRYNSVKEFLRGQQSMLTTKKAMKVLHASLSALNISAKYEENENIRNQEQALLASPTYRPKVIQDILTTQKAKGFEPAGYTHADGMSYYVMKAAANDKTTVKEAADYIVDTMMKEKIPTERIVAAFQEDNMKMFKPYLEASLHRKNVVLYQAQEKQAAERLGSRQEKENSGVSLGMSR